METKLSQVAAAAAAGDWQRAFSIAAKFPRLGEEKRDIVRAHEALLRPQFYRELGQDPEAIIEHGKIVMLKKYQKAIAEAIMRLE